MPGITGNLSMRSSEFCEPVLRGVICRRVMATGKTLIAVFAVGGKLPRDMQRTRRHFLRRYKSDVLLLGFKTIDDTIWQKQLIIRS